MGGRITGTIVFMTTLPEADFEALWKRSLRVLSPHTRETDHRPWTLAEKKECVRLFIQHCAAGRRVDDA